MMNQSRGRQAEWTAFGVGLLRDVRKLVDFMLITRLQTPPKIFFLSFLSFFVIFYAFFYFLLPLPSNTRLGQPCIRPCSPCISLTSVGHKTVHLRSMNSVHMFITFKRIEQESPWWSGFEEDQLKSC